MPCSPPQGRASASFRSIFLSDVHLGSPRSQAELLLDFLTCSQAEYLYLVGDIADAPSASALWPETHRAVLEAMRSKASQGTRVHYLQGNHDPHFSELWGGEWTLHVATEVEHLTADGRRLWVVHGDGFDHVVHHRRWLSRVGDALARALERLCDLLERPIGRRRARLGPALRERCKQLLGYTARFERTAVVAARLRRVDGVICGHVHSAASRMIDGLYYGNGGDWVGSATALVEHVDGRFELVSWEQVA